ncbi:MAG: GTP-binding protein [Candidatus Lokiarchaeota archaeon]|nr:GTP-binding protein [Candidatus Lokiarchaeota archaeon]
MLKRKNFQNLNNLDIYSYPEDIDKKENNKVVLKIIHGHDNGSLIEPCCENTNSLKNSNEKKSNTNPFVISSPISQVIGDQNIFTICINSEMLVGLIFEKEDNPFDYKEIFEDLSHELLNSEKSFSFKDEIEIENFLITLFIDIKRFGDETLEKAPEFSFQPSGIFTKVFLFGIDNVGKTSLTRRVKTGQYTDNFFTPSKRFNIEYIQKEDGLLSIWDSPGQSSFRERWLLGLQDSNIIIYMIDVANQLRFEESKREFWKIINQNEFKDVPLLILGNKIDLINHDNHNIDDESLERTRKEIIEFFEFEKLENSNWKFVFTSVKTSYNIEKSLNTIFALVSE